MNRLNAVELATLRRAPNFHATEFLTNESVRDLLDRPFVLGRFVTTKTPPAEPTVLLRHARTLRLAGRRHGIQAILTLHHNGYYAVTFHDAIPVKPTELLAALTAQP